MHNHVSYILHDSFYQKNRFIFDGVIKEIIGWRFGRRCSLLQQ